MPEYVMTTDSLVQQLVKEDEQHQNIPVTDTIVIIDFKPLVVFTVNLLLRHKQTLLLEDANALAVILKNQIIHALLTRRGVNFVKSYDYYIAKSMEQLQTSGFTDIQTACITQLIETNIATIFVENYPEIDNFSRNHILKFQHMPDHSLVVALSDKKW